MRSDAELMIAFQGGDDKAFDELVGRYYQPVLSYLLRLSENSALAEDLCQEAFAKLFYSRDKYRPLTTFKAFLFSIARNSFIDAYRKDKRQKSVSFDGGGGEMASSGDIYVSKERSSEEILDGEEKMEKILRAVYQLPDILRDVFILSEIEQLKYSEISEVLNIPIGTVKSRMFNSVKLLQKSLKGCV